jgi:predicted peptidase
MPPLASAALVSAAASLMAVTTAHAAPPDPLHGYTEQSIRFTGGPYHDEAFKYLLLKPDPIEPGKQYPVILFLHGAGERGNDNRLQLKHFPETMSTAERRRRYPAFIIAPQCPAGKRWVEVNWSAKRSSPQTAEPGPTLGMALAALNQVLKTEPVDRRRVYLTGLSMGGYGAWDLGTRHPELFAAVVPICGGGDEAKAAALKDMPVWAFHGSRDNVVPPARSQAMIAAIRKAGGEPKYTELPGVGHDSWVKAYADESGLLDWMFQQAQKK